MIVTAKAGNTLTVTRGANGTTAAAHSNGAAVNPAFDQRGAGFARKFGSAVDIGAFEVQTLSPCPNPQGYWKNNPALWPVNSLMLGSQTYNKTELLKILKTAIGTGKKADASLILADQLIAAKLNIANGADATQDVSDTIDDADSLLSVYPVGSKVKTNSTNGQMMVNYAAILESYNKGLLTTGCSP